MERTDNIEFFNIFTLSLFDRLYSKFPTPIDVDAGAIASELAANESKDDVWYEKVTAASHALDFLHQEGFITYKSKIMSEGKFAQVRLSAKGLAVLNAVPDSLETKEPVIGKVRNALAGGVKEAGSESVRQLVQHLLTAGLAAAPSVIARLGG
jgi:hypothetical protein